jgi:hypothetical protein
MKIDSSSNPSLIRSLLSLNLKSPRSSTVLPLIVPPEPNFLLAIFKIFSRLAVTLPRNSIRVTTFPHFLLSFTIWSSCWSEVVIWSQTQSSLGSPQSEQINSP